MSTFSERIQTGNDDGYRYFFGSYTWYPSLSTMEVGYWSGSNYSSPIGLRFQNVTIPKNATINSAKLTLVAKNNYTNNPYNFVINGIAEDNTASMSSDPSGRSTTSNAVNWDTGAFSANSAYDTPNITAIVQEIVNRSGWSSGNAMGFLIASRLTAGLYPVGFYPYDSDSSKAVLITIDYTNPPGNSASLSPSLSASLSPSSSQSPSASASLSASMTPSPSPSPSAMPIETLCMKIAKKGVNVLTNSDIDKLLFDSTKGTLKYFDVGTIDVTVKSNSTDLEIAGHATYTHSLGYYPDTEVYMKSGDNYIRCPVIMAGASVTYKGDYQTKENTLEFYAENSGYPAFSSNQTYTFIYFIFKNNLHL